MIHRLKELKMLVPKRNKTAYIGWVGRKNLGDEILYEAHKMLFPELGFVHYTSSRVIDQVEKVLPSFHFACLGGGTLINQGRDYLRLSEQAVSIGLPIFCLGSGVGDPKYWKDVKKSPMGKFIDEWALLLNRFQFVGVRGPLSKKYLNNAGYKDAVVVGDTALALAANEYEVSDSKVVGINYGDVEGNPMHGDSTTYYNEMVNFIEKIVGEGYRVKMLPVWDRDVPSNEKLLRTVNSDKVELIECYESLEEYNTELSECSFFVGQKLHSTIMATMLRIPSIMVEYRPKCLDYMTSIGMQDYNIKTSEFNADKAFGLLTSLNKDRINVISKIDEHVMDYKNRLIEGAGKVKSLLKF